MAKYAVSYDDYTLWRITISWANTGKRETHYVFGILDSMEIGDFLAFDKQDEQEFARSLGVFKKLKKHDDLLIEGIERIGLIYGIEKHEETERSSEV